MKKIICGILSALLVFGFVSAAFAAPTLGKAELTAEPVYGKVGDIVLVNVYLTANLRNEYTLDSMQGTLIYDPEYLTFGDYQLKDAENRLDSVSNSASGMWVLNGNEKGIVKFAFASSVGIEQDGFLIQLRFRIEKEGTSNILLNGFEYHDFSLSYQDGESYYLEPFILTGISTEGYTPDVDADVNLEFESMAKETAAPQQNEGGPVVEPQQTASSAQTENPTKDVHSFQDASQDVATKAPSDVQIDALIPNEPDSTVTQVPSVQIPDESELPDADGTQTEQSNEDPTGEEPNIEISTEVVPDTNGQPADDADDQTEATGSIGVIGILLLVLGGIAIVLIGIVIVFLIVRRHRK